MCGFANAQGGKIVVGKTDTGEVCGVSNAQKLLETIPQKIRNQLGLIADVNLHHESGNDYLEVIIKVSSAPISYRGHYYYRTGSTNMELTGNSLNEFLLKKAGNTWDAVIEERATLDDIDENSVHQYINDAKTAGRIPNVESLSTLELLNGLRLLRDGKVTRAALVMFGKDPGMFFPNMMVKIGRFGKDHADLLFEEAPEGNLVFLLREVLVQLEHKFLVKPVRFEGMKRIEMLEYPVEALREILLNALVHKNYMGSMIQMRVYDYKLTLWNPGELPEEVPVEKLTQTHQSIPRNPLVAGACYKAGYIDAWGRGIQKITDACEEYKIPAPKFEAESLGLTVILKNRLSLEAAEKNQEGPGRDQVTAEVTGVVTGEVTGVVTGEVKRLLAAIKNEMSRKDLQASLGLKHEDHFRNSYLVPALELGLVEMTIPGKPQSRLQKYRLSAKGKAYLDSHR